MASTPWSPSPAQPPAPQTAAYELRPLSLGEILDRIFTVYRSRFWLFCGLMTAPALIRILLAGVAVALAHFLRTWATQATISLVTIAVGYTASLIGFLVFSVANAALMHALYETYQGRDATIAGSFSAVSGRWLRYLGIGVWQLFTSAGLYLLFVVPGLVVSTRATAGQDATMMMAGGGLVILGALAGIPVGVILYLRNALAIPASVLENLPVRAAMRRSKVLTKGAKGKLFVVLLVAFAMYLVVSMLEAPLGYLIFMAAIKHKEALGAQAVNLVIAFLGISLVGPIGALGLGLMYFDQRVRQEAWDLELLLGGPQAAGAATMAPTTAVVVEDGPWVQPPQSRFITWDEAQPEPTGGIYEALVARPQTPRTAPEPSTQDASMQGEAIPGTNDHGEGL